MLSSCLPPAWKGCGKECLGEAYAGRAGPDVLIRFHPAGEVPSFAGLPAAGVAGMDRPPRPAGSEACACASSC